MSLGCREVCFTERILRAPKDPTMFDPRVLRNLLELEERYLVSTTYFDCVQRDVKPYMRRMVATWMMQVCEEQRCEEDVFPLSMNYLDRFLSVAVIHRTQLQSLGAACMLLASKVKETLPLTTEKLVIYTDNSVTQDELLEFELMLLMQLKWDVLAVTAIDFVDQLLFYLNLDCDSCTSARKHANAFIHLCCTDHKFSVYTPSMMAASCVAAAVFGIVGSPRHHLLQKLQEITSVDSDILHECLEQVESALRSNLHQNALHSNKHPEHSGEVQGCGAGVGDRVPSDSESHTSSVSTESRHSHNTPTDVDMIF